jgi:hypothetical protein
VTTSDTQAIYNATATIKFSMTVGGKIGIGTIFHSVNGGPVTTGSSVTVTGAGTYNLEFWSVDQAGRVESPVKQASFEITVDVTAPVTTSNAQAAYYQSAQITLSASDVGGVKATHYILDEGPTQNGKNVYVAGVSGQTVNHTLEFWSEDWWGNSETHHIVNFSITTGTGTFRFYTGPLAVDEWVEWCAWKGSPQDNECVTAHHKYPHDGPYAGGYDELVVPLSATQYYIMVTWGSAIEPYDEQRFGYYPVTVPGFYYEFY